MTTAEIKTAIDRCDRKTKDIVFAFLIELLDAESREQLSRFLSLIA